MRRRYPRSASSRSSSCQRAGVDGCLVAELAAQRVEVDVVHPGAGVLLAQLLGEGVELGEVLQDAGAVTEAESLIAAERLATVPVLAGSQCAQGGVEASQRLLQRRVIRTPAAPSTSSSSRCSGVIELSIRWAAAARWARASMSSSTFRGFSGKSSPCLSMNSANCSGVSSPRACASSRSLRSSSMALTRWRSSSVAPSQRLLHAREALVEQLAAEQVLDPLVVLPGLGAAPFVVGQLGHRRRGRGRQVPHPHLGEPGVVVEVAGQLLALGEHGAVEQLADLLEGAVESVPVEQVAPPPLDEPSQVVEAPLLAATAAQELPHRPRGRVPGHDVLADRLECLGEIDRGGQRVATGVAGVPGQVRGAVLGVAHRRATGVPITLRTTGSPVDRLAVDLFLADLARQVQPLERQLDGPRLLAVVAGIEALDDPVVRVGPAQGGQPLEERPRSDLLAGRHAGATVEGHHQGAQVDAAEPLAHRLGDGRAQQVHEHLALAALLAGLELDLAAEHVDDGVEVDRPGHRGRLALGRGPVQGGGGQGLGRGDREPRRDAGALVDAGARRAARG